MDGRLHALELLLEGVDLLVLLHGQFLQDAHLFLALFVFLQVAVFVERGLGVGEWNEVFYFFGGKGDELLEGLFEGFVLVSQGESLGGICNLTFHLAIFDLQLS